MIICKTLVIIMQSLCKDDIFFSFIQVLRGEKCFKSLFLCNNRVYNLIKWGKEMYNCEIDSLYCEFVSAL